jgi:hypothetical protein
MRIKLYTLPEGGSMSYLLPVSLVSLKCLEHSRCLINACWMNVTVNNSFSLLTFHFPLSLLFLPHALRPN